MPIVLPLLIALLTLLAVTVLPLSPRAARRLALLGPLAVTAAGVALWPEVGGEVERVAWAWMPSLDLPLSLRVDRLGVFFVLLVGVVGLGIFQYAGSYMPDAGGGFWGALLAFTLGMILIVVADSLVVLLCGWELTTLMSALLIGLEHGNAASRRGAVQAFVVTGAGGLALLAGAVLLVSLGGSWELSALEARAEQIVADRRHEVPLLLLLLAAFTKSAQVPFHFWLPGAMAAPAPISAYLHSATMVKAGIFLLARLLPIFGGSPIWQPTLATVGLVTFLLAGWHAVRATDLKVLLAWSTVSYLGLLTASYGYFPRIGAAGALVAIGSHALYKASLFLLIGWVEKLTGSRDLEDLAPVRWLGTSPLGAALIVVAAAAMAALPFTVGYAGKDVTLGAIADGSTDFLTLPVLAFLVGSAFTTVHALKLSGSVLSGRRPRGEPVRRPSRWLLAAPAAFLALQLLGGLAPGALLGALEPDRDWAPAVWQAFDAKLAVGLAALALGAALYAVWWRLAALPAGPSAEALSRRGALGVVAGSAWTSRALQAGGHARYVGAVLASAVAVVVAGVAWAPPLGETRADWGVETCLAAVPVIAIVIGAPAAVAMPGRVAKLVLVAAVGYGMAILYVMLRAPDLALTQLLVETVGLLLLLLVFRHLPTLGPDRRSRRRRAVHGVLAGSVGVAMGTLAWFAGASEAEAPMGASHLALSHGVAKGDNVVNVILVDFRGLDTLGEIAVLAVAAVGAVAVLTARSEEVAG